jgi:hypothetical protein
MKLAFTGTQDGMTEMQGQFVFNTMMDLEPSEAHHGMCIGSDEEFDGMLDYAHDCIVHGHPPINQRKMSKKCECDVVHEPKDYIPRNHDIVDATDALLAAPKGPEELRSGTWATIRYARKLKRPIYIVWPSGKMTAENVVQQDQP